MIYPFKQKKYKKYIERVFLENVDSEELIWHKDKRDRIIKVVKSDKWMLQFDNLLPFVLEENNNYIIPNSIYHRVHKGNGNLIIQIYEF